MKTTRKAAARKTPQKTTRKTQAKAAARAAETPKPDIGTLLAQSRAAHLAYRAALAVPDLLAAGTALHAAAALRTAAAEADPHGTDPAWLAEAVTHPHHALLEFYRHEIGKA